MIKPARTIDTREHLLATGESIILSKGYAAVGLAEILSQAGVPKGSFYHYFRSKEGFGVEMLQRYFEDYDQRLLNTLQQGDVSGRTRLLRYFQFWHQRHKDGGCHRGCLAVKLSGEVSDLSEPMREALANGMERIVMRLAGAISTAQQDGSLAPYLDPQHCAQALYALWIGSSLLHKVLQLQQPLDMALTQTESMLPVAS
jgi:TetR/AcrR family transcriptional repressor of nem operon